MLPVLYPILDVEISRARGLTPLALLETWLDAGVRLVQLRAKTMGGAEFLALARAAVDRCTAAGATFIVNDRADIARMSRAHGVHVGQTDLAPADARAIVGDRAIVGVSTHSEAQANEAVLQRIDYLAIGPVYATTTTDAGNPTVGLEGVRHAFRIATGAGRPLVAIGGITLERMPEVLTAGASSVAVISDLLTGDPAERIRQFLQARARRA